jgi:hypothetical protein
VTNAACSYIWLCRLHVLDLRSEALPIFLLSVVLPSRPPERLSVNVACSCAAYKSPAHFNAQRAVAAPLHLH